MSKILAVFGATGNQGSSVINHILNSPTLSAEYSIRAITRDLISPKSKSLAEKVSVVQGDVLDRTSLETALTGVHTIFAMTTPSFAPNGLEIEYNAAKSIADVAVSKGVQYIIFSTLPSVTEFSNGKYTHVTPFDAKAKAEKYIQGLTSIKSSFYAGGYFMENFASQPFLGPQKSEDGETWVLSRPMSEDTLFPYVDAVNDTGKFIGAILEEPERFEGKVLYGVERFYSLKDICEILSKTTGKKVRFERIEIEVFRRGLGFLPEGLVDIFVDGMGGLEEFGYFGKGNEDLVEWSRGVVKGKLTRLEEYLTKNPLVLE